MILASSETAHAAHQLVLALQARMVAAQEAVAGERGVFRAASWLRDDGRHGGGTRLSAGGGTVFDRASVNVSQVHYDDEPSKLLSSATALSTIIHPRNPHAPSVHIHVSWTQMRDSTGYWRIMADLNPAIRETALALAAKQRFAEALRAAAPTTFAEASQQGDRYFYIPALHRHRGVVHFYLEQYATADRGADAALARRVAETAIDTHAAIVAEALPTVPDRAAHEAQLAYHTLYLFQVLTLDRGTTSGLLVHDQNDVGILGSLPSRVDPALLASWRTHVPSPVDRLVDDVLAVLPDGEIDDSTKRALAAAVRAFYRAHPEALELQARGDVTPPTVANHR